MKRLSFFCPEETTAKLRCPERGFYSILRFMAEEKTVLPDIALLNPNDTLVLIEINLKNYSDRALSERALSGINGLFQMLRNTGSGLIVRFLYDWSGKNMLTEPKSVDIITGHMKQLGSVIRENADIIYILQGLFVGNWGEMHGSRYIRGDYLKRLYATLSQETGKLVRIAVRTPALWRSVTGISFFKSIGLDASLPGLFNDGMLGNESEYGTFSDNPSKRNKELMLQKMLCQFVPYGGEVVGTAPQSDAERAMTALEVTGVSYLNRLYDENTLIKWKNAVVNNNGIWSGMNYFDYAEAHLGYRFVIRGVKMRCHVISGAFTANILVVNTGFAPVYHNTAAELVFVSENRQFSFPLEGNVDRLSRTEGTRCLTLKLSSVNEHLGNGTYDIYFRLKSLKYNVYIPTANRGTCEAGCLIGRYTIL